MLAMSHLLVVYAQAFGLAMAIIIASMLTIFCWLWLKRQVTGIWRSARGKAPRNGRYPRW